MDYTITEKTGGLHIDASVPPEAQHKLMEELAKCAAGTCTCPSTQYDKLQNIQVEPDQNGVAIDLTAKPGETIDRADIERCLAHTARQVEP